MDSQPPQVTEKQMEDMIAANPEFFLGESGLRLLRRQLTIGPYRFDLMFEDRHGAHLIVELQRGILDRPHTYKILDYYHEYKDQHPETFVEIMVIANTITAERKQRLQQLGVEYKEIPVAHFLAHLAAPAQPAEPANLAPESCVDEDTPVASEDSSVRSLQRLFVHVTRDFRERVRDVDPGAKFNMIQSLPDDGHNWFITWVPGPWGRPTKGFGVHWGLACGQQAKAPSGRFRLVLGCESPLLPEYKHAFMLEIVSRARLSRLSPGSFELIDTAPKQRKLARSAPMPLGLDAGAAAFELYNSFAWFGDIVAETMKEWNAQGRFDPPLRDP